MRSQVVSRICPLILKSKTQKRFPLPVDTEGNDIEHEPQIEYIAQSNQWDIEFLLALARRVGYVIFIKEEEKEGEYGQTKTTLFWALRW